MLKIWQNSKFYLIVVLILMAALLAWRSPAETENCALCGQIKCHAPCLVNLATGEVGELALFIPHPTLAGEIAQEQTGGTLAFFSCAGHRAMQDTDARTCAVQIPKSSKTANPHFFCRACRKRLSGTRGYALADLYDPNQIQTYPVQDGAVYDIRDYRVSIDWDGAHTVFNVVNFFNPV